MDPPLDFFGKTQTPYINGRPVIRTWLGCFCTALLVSLTFLISITYFKNFKEKSLSSTNSIESKSKEPEQIDLKKIGTAVIYELQSFQGEYSKMFSLEYNEVTIDKQRKVVSKIPIELTEC